MGRWVRGLLWVLGLLALLVVVLRALALDSWTIPEDPVLSASMEPTLRGGDTVIVLRRGTPGFSDLVRCPDPEDAQRWVVGRIVAVENDILEVTGADLVVNGKRYTGETACAEPIHKVRHPSTLSEVVVACDVVSMGGGWHYRGTGPGRSGTTTRVVVPKGMVFLLSDSRDLHDDSRDFGALPAASCHERLVFRVWGAKGWTDEPTRLTLIR